MILISKKLTGSENYTMWKRSMMIALSARNKIKLINGEFKEPDVSSPIRSYWERANDMVISWILNTVSEQISNNLNFVNSAHSLWHQLHDHYSQLDGHRIYQLHNEIVHLKQMNCSVEVFYHKLKEQMVKEIRGRLIQFLMGLDESYTNIRGQILLLQPLPIVVKTHSMLRHEEKQREVPKQTTSSVPFALNTYMPNTPYVAARNNSSRAINMTVVHDTPIDSDTSSTHMTTLTPDCSVTARMNHLQNQLNQGHDGITTQGILCGGLYILPNPSTSSTSFIPSPTIITSTTKSSMWHARLGHPSTQVLKNIKQLSASETKDLATSCNICPLAKHHALPFVPSLSNATSKFELVHMDVWGPYHHPTLNKCKLFLIIVDDFSRATWTYLLPNKHHVTTTIKHFHSYVHTQFKTQIQKIRTDNGTEFVNSSLTEFFNDKGIIHQTSCPYTPQQNARVERKHRHLLEVARALQFQANFPKHLWGYYILASTYLINRLPSPLLHNKSPYELLYNHPPPLEHLKIIGCRAYPHQHTPDKFNTRAIPIIFIGYPQNQKGYLLYDPLTTKVITIPFHSQISPPNPIPPPSTMSTPIIPYPSNIFPSHPNTSPSSPETTTSPSSPIPNTPPLSHAPVTSTEPNTPFTTPITSHTSSTHPTPPNSSPAQDNHLPSPQPPPPPPQRVSTRTKQPPLKFANYHLPSKLSKHHHSNFLNYTNLTPSSMHFINSIDRSFEPHTYFQASKDPKWIEAMAKEIKALKDNKTWILTQLPPGKSAIGHKWVYRIKYLANGSVEKYKARVVAKGYNQKEGVDYKETFAPKAKMVTVRTLLAVAISKGWFIEQLDINNAFLHGDLHEEVYMTVLQGYSKSLPPNTVCKLIKSLYGLKQENRQWFEKLTSFLLSKGFTQSYADTSLMTLNHNNSLISVPIYVDDILITCNDQSFINNLKSQLHDTFSIKDLGPINYYLGIE
ncbi:putative RNA-directed DNA polymerase, partial [Tanacetum coccineum]